LFKYISSEWKVAKIKMLEKKQNDSHNLNNYRPICLTNCIVKLKEKLIKARLIHFLEKNNLLIANQSGFREHKRTIDNIFLSKKSV
jgi:hypothetical protein